MVASVTLPYKKNDYIELDQVKIDCREFLDSIKGKVADGKGFKVLLPHLPFDFPSLTLLVSLELVVLLKLEYPLLIDISALYREIPSLSLNKVKFDFIETLSNNADCKLTEEDLLLIEIDGLLYIERRLEQLKKFQSSVDYSYQRYMFYGKRIGDDYELIKRQVIDGEIIKFIKTILLPKLEHKKLELRSNLISLSS
jgi:hypothetical protein